MEFQLVILLNEIRTQYIKEKNQSTSYVMAYWVINSRFLCQEWFYCSCIFLKKIGKDCHVCLRYALKELETYMYSEVSNQPIAILSKKKRGMKLLFSFCYFFFVCCMHVYYFLFKQVSEIYCLSNLNFLKKILMDGGKRVYGKLFIYIYLLPWKILGDVEISTTQK